MPQVQIGNHIIEFSNSVWGTETIKYDGIVKAKGYSLLGRSYMFRAKEDDEEVSYEVEFKLGFLSTHFTVRRNGLVIFTS